MIIFFILFIHLFLYFFFNNENECEFSIKNKFPKISKKLSHSFFFSICLVLAPRPTPLFSIRSYIYERFPIYIEILDIVTNVTTILMAVVSLFLFVPGPARSAMRALVRHCSVCTYYYLHERICAGVPSTRGSLCVSDSSTSIGS